jgi:hypothetical protein
MTQRTSLPLFYPELAATPSLVNFTLDMPDVQKYFTLFLSLARGCAVEITESNFPFFATLLENPELYQFLFSIHPDPLTLVNAPDGLSLFAQLFIPRSDELHFAAAAIDPPLLSDILRSLATMISVPRSNNGLNSTGNNHLSLGKFEPLGCVIE